MGVIENPFFLTQKTILITGASSGIGRAVAVECSKLGARCIITGRNEKRLQETLDALAGEGHLSIIADLAEPEGIDKLADKTPEVDGIVCNAGVVVTKPVAFYKPEDLSYVFGINTFSPMLIIKAFLKRKKIKSGGSIVFTSSAAADSAVAGNGIYGASKAALTNFMRYCALELGPRNIRVNAVQPGMVETDLIHGGAVSEADLAKDKTLYPLGRYGKPEEIAYGIIYLISDASAWTTGTSLVIDGGYSVW